MIDKDSYTKNKFIEEPALKHKEHIIQNSLIGRLKSEIILCEKCGGKLNKDVDSGFTNLFAVFTEVLREKVAPKDHGENNSSNVLKGYLFLDQDLKDGININFKDFHVTLKKPNYKVDEQDKIIRIYGNKYSAKQFEPRAKKELKEKGYDINLYTIEYVTDMSNQGILSLFFSEGVEQFNDKFLLGLNKIATGFAYHNGIKREDLTRSLNLTKGQENIIYSKNVIPFIPIGSFDILLELNRPEIETNYPTHTLILFTQKIC